MRARTVAAAVISAALILGGAFMLVGDDVKQEMKTAEIQPYTVSVEVVEQLDRITDELMQDTDATEPVTVTESWYTDAPDAVTEPVAVYDTLPAETMRELIAAAQTLTGAYPDAIGWLIIPGTNINYPLMQGSDNDFYLHHAYDGSKLSAGSIFLDWRCEQHLLNGINICYGHNMKNGSMFAGITKFGDTEYFNAHRYGWLATSDKVYRLDFFSLAHVDCDDSFYDGSQPVTDWIPRVERLSTICTGIEYDASDRFMSLSTCTRATGDDRTVLTGRLVEMMGDDVYG
ncbi:MAG: class B sortase [Oscillospiraceae bacterium]|nr:class B sortase [Oscillospiraceae bacterium]